MQIVDPGRPTGNMMQRVFDVLQHAGPKTVAELEEVLEFSEDSLREVIRRLKALHLVERVDRVGKFIRYAIRKGAQRPGDGRGSHLRKASA